MENTDKKFETSDLGTAAFLIVSGCALLEAGTSRGRYSFVFADYEKCHPLAVKYIGSEYSKFDSALKNLRNLIKQ